MLHDLRDGFMVMDAIDCLIKGDERKRIPVWVYIVDYALTTTYIVGILAFIVIVLRYLING